MMRSQKVVVAMSGGVDSSVAAALLKEQGYQVIGMMLRLWSEPGAEESNRCCTPDSMAQARRVAALLDIPFYAVDAQEFFYGQVVQYFLDGYTKGDTPNPCIACNRHIRWQYLYDRARALGAEYMATGHYARIETNGSGGYLLKRAVDQNKDQSYVLHVLSQDKLAHALFPLGPYTKPEVRELARHFDLPVAERSESQDLCFLGDGDYRQFLKRNAPDTAQPGPIILNNGERLGEHQGLAFYTIGQRKGLGLASPIPLYVLHKDIQNNALIVGEAQELGRDEMVAGPMHWVSGQAPQTPVRAMVKIRYKAKDAPGVISPLGENRVHIRLDEALRDITPGQAAVIYNDESDCLGGGIILPENSSGNNIAPI